MKLSITLILAILFTTVITAQRTVYLNNSFKVTDSIRATHKRVVTEDSSMGLTKYETYYIVNDSLQSKGYVVTANTSIKSGTWQWYYRNGNKKSSKTYSKGRIVGNIANYYENGDLREIYYFDKSRESEAPHNLTYFKDTSGNIQIENGNGDYNGSYDIGRLDKYLDSLSGSYVSTKPHGKWKGFNKGELIMEETYDNGVLVKGNIVFNGRKKTYRNLLESASPPISQDKMYQKFKMNFNYYLERLKKDYSNVSLKFKMNFRIASNGEIQGLRIIDGMGEGPDEAAIRAFRELDLKWNPVTCRGIPINSTLTIPIVFGIQN